MIVTFVEVIPEIIITIPISINVIVTKWLDLIKYIEKSNLPSRQVAMLRMT